ncbi:MAG: DUF2868 domain-containing protein, partial [Desulfococcus multivorans]|nr:DUF2868 domain-containing protein [Desulfococcus multivorans]
SLTGVLGGRRTLYGSIFFWPVFVLAQTMAVMFNLGILAAVLLKHSITDLAFGWQSTLHPGPETVLSLVEGFSLPWSFLPAAHPSLAQIQGSQMVLKEGMVHLATPDLVSWWPFLCYALLWYGLAPRLLLLFFGVFRQRRLLNALNFSTGACDRLIHRMRTPVVHTQSRAYRPVPDSETEAETRKTAEAAGRQQASVEALPALVLVPEDIRELCHDPGLPMILEKALGLSTAHALIMTMDPDADMKTISSALETLAKNAEGPRLVLLMEAWQPPIRETLNWLTRLRQTAGSRMGVIVALLGKPGKETPFPPPAPTDRMVWERAVTGLGDPFVRVESIGGGP